MSTPKLGGAPERPAQPLEKLAKSVLTKLILEPGLGENIVVVALPVLPATVQTRTR